MRELKAPLRLVILKFGVKGVIRVLYDDFCPRCNLNKRRIKPTIATKLPIEIPAMAAADNFEFVE